MPIAAEILNRFPADAFVETGTFTGDGVRAAIEAGFGRIISMELAPERHAQAAARWGDDFRVTLLCGSSADLMPGVLADLGVSSATFFLDAHGYSGRGDSDNPCPLLAELDIIAAYRAGRGDVILIDDYNVMDRAFRTGVSEADVRERLLAINPGALLVRIDNPHLQWDIMGALPW